MDAGFNVEYDGDCYHTMTNIGVKEYPVGGLMFEYRRLNPSSIKSIINRYPALDEEASVDGYYRFLVWLLDEMKDDYDLVSAMMVQAEFANTYMNLHISGELESEELLEERMSLRDLLPDVRKYILDGTGSDKFSNKTVGDLIRLCYYMFAENFVFFGMVFQGVTELYTEEDKTEIGEIIMSYFGEKAEMAQDIGYKIMFYDGNFHSVYTIKDSLSLLLFEFAHMLQKECTITKCENCGQYFIPTGRKDAIYCDYPSPQDHTKKCSEIGAQIARKEKLKSNEAEHEYRKLYMRLKMQAKRHPDDSKYHNAIENLKKCGKDWRKQISDGERTTDEFLEWILRYNY